MINNDCLSNLHSGYVRVKQECFFLENNNAFKTCLLNALIWH